MAKISKSDFIAGIEKSRLLAPNQLTDFLKSFDGDAPPEIAKNLVRQDLATKWQAKYLLSGRTRLDIGNYRLLDRIQRNEFGDRFLAVHTSLARKVDLQVLPGSLTQDQSSCNKFIQKASLAATLDHPNLAHVYDIDQEGGRYFLVTEHIEGKVLPEASPDSLDESRIAEIVTQAVAGIRYAHKHDVIHGCISQNDLILSENGQVKIQHLPLSPLRQQNSNVDSPNQTLDVDEIANIGSELLSSSSVLDANHVDDLKKALASLRKGTKESVDSAINMLNLMIQKNPASTNEASHKFNGDFDQPIAASSPPKSDSTANPKFEEIAAPGYLVGLWRENPVAVIATAAVMALLLIGGSVYAGIQIASQSSDQQSKESKTVAQKSVDSVKTARDKKNNSSNKKLNTTSKRTNKLVTPSDEDMSALLKDLPPGTDKLSIRGQSEIKNSDDPPMVATPPNGDVAKQGPTNILTEATGSEVQPTDTSAAGTNGAKGNSNGPSGDTPGTMTPDVDASMTPVEVAPELHEDLDRDIIGIGEKTQTVLNLAGVTSLEQLAQMSPEQVKAALVKGGWFNANQMSNYKNWITQAKLILGDETPMSTETVAVDTANEFNTSPPTNLTGPFAKFPRVVGLPPTDDLQEVFLGNVAIKPSHLLGAKLVCEKGYAKGKTLFELQRASDNNQKWLVGLKKSEKHDPIFVGAFVKRDQSVYFNWLPEASTEKTAKKLATYLQNCYLNLFSDDDSTFVTLREPIKFPDLRLTQDSPINEIEFAIPSMPNPETVVVEVMPMRVPNTETFVNISRIERNIPAVIWLKKNDKTGFLRIRVTGELRSKIRLRSDFVLILPNGQLQSVSNLASLGDLKATLDRTAYQARVVHNNFTKPQNMTRTDFDARKKELLKDANAKQRVKDQINNYSEILPKLLNQPISVRVYSKLGNLQTVLAVTDSTMPQDESNKK